MDFIGLLVKQNNDSYFQHTQLMLHGFRRDECNLNNWIRPNGLGPNGLPLTNAATLLMENITFTPGTCGYLCPTSLNKMNDNTGRKWTPKFAEYKVIIQMNQSLQESSSLHNFYAF